MWRFTSASIWTMVALVVAGLLWSFFSRADVLVTAPGTLVPASDVRRVYAPIDGELANIYIAEGQPVLKGDVVARLYARGAIEAARNALEARRARDAARDEAAKYERLFGVAGGGGVSQLQVEQKKNSLQAAENALRVAESRVSELAARQSLETKQARSELETSGQQLSSLRLQYEAATREATNLEERLRLQMQTARLVTDAAARIQFENIDKDSFLRIAAPVDGVITDVTSTQTGDKIQANTPLGGIAP